MRGTGIRRPSLLGHLTEPGPNKQLVRARSWITPSSGLCETVFTLVSQSTVRIICLPPVFSSPVLLLPLPLLNTLARQDWCWKYQVTTHRGNHATLSKSRQHAQPLLWITDPIPFHLPRLNNLRADKYLENEEHKLILESQDYFCS